ncbi:hypothetical protein K466DRAFT_506315 [Polyporus arcularius HHB13444]|uniref:Uncharacterized protein n=1 Tax=Polyporus arcularius HHB13444 TaxID=1314778 RepID=A0A5C3NPT1_9APHY|nr:hypothetical protein K466DRAFT_506315 [Polyporus arcularius HHB13444]
MRELNRDQPAALTRPYISRPSRTQMLEKPKLLAKLMPNGKPSVEVPEEFKSKSGIANRILEAKEKERARSQDKGEGSSKKRRRYVPPPLVDYPSGNF